MAKCGMPRANAVDLEDRPGPIEETFYNTIQP